MDVLYNVSVGLLIVQNILLTQIPNVSIGSPFQSIKIKLPVRRIFCIFESHARPIESSMEDQISFVEFGGLLNVPIDCLLLRIETSTQMHSIFDN